MQLLVHKSIYCSPNATNIEALGRLSTTKDSIGNPMLGTDLMLSKFDVETGVDMWPQIRWMCLISM